MGMTLGTQEVLGMQPEVEGVIGCPEYFVNGWRLDPTPDVMSASLYCERRMAGTRLVRFETVRLHFPITDWKRCNAITAAMVRHAPHLFLLKPGH